MCVRTSMHVCVHIIMHVKRHVWECGGCENEGRGWEECVGDAGFLWYRRRCRNRIFLATRMPPKVALTDFSRQSCAKTYATSPSLSKPH